MGCAQDGAHEVTKKPATSWLRPSGGGGRCDSSIGCDRQLAPPVSLSSSPGWVVPVFR